MSARAAEKAENPSLGVSEKVSAIDAYVRNVEKNISSSQRKEQMLTPGELKNGNERELDEDPYLL